MSTTRGPWRVNPREQWHNGRRTEQDVSGRVKPGHRASAMGGEYAE